MYEVSLSQEARQAYEKADRPLRRKLVRCFQQLELEPHTHPNIKPLTGPAAGQWRYRVGDWRVIYVIIEQEVKVTVIEIQPRGRAYRRKK